jgi:hypothetical protein
MEEYDRALESEATEVSVRDAVLDVEIQMRAAEYEDAVDAGLRDWPQVTWSGERDGDTVVVRHEAGDPVRADWLSTSFFPAVESPPTLFESGTVGPGDEATLDVAALPAETQQVALSASPPGGDTTARVFSMTLDDEDA